MNKEIVVKYSPEFGEQFHELRKIALKGNSKFHKQLLKAIEREKEILYRNPHNGIQVKKRQIPKEYIDKYGVNNLWKINLPNFWRMIYTITGNELEIISILLEFIDHERYNKVFGYRKK
tara:strand:+ start:322 stop:678 length:357 start_codon:yes stop_codon:yes gene_type:complete